VDAFTGGSRRQSCCGSSSGERRSKDESPLGRDLRSIAGAGARDWALTAELSGRIKEGGAKASIDPRSERPFNEERQFGEAKLPVFEME
jgi:hypothetical protein